MGPTILAQTFPPPTVLPPISIKAETLFDIPLPWGVIHFTNSMLQTMLVIAGISIFFFLATRKMKLIPRGIQNYGEAIVEFLLGMTEGTAGKRVGRRIFPLVASLFIFILVANYSGLLPGVGTIGSCHPHAAVTEGSQEHLEAEEEAGGLLTAEEYCPAGTEFIPFLRAPNADLNMTLAMALLAVGVVQVAGIAAHGFGGYFRELATPLFLTPIHIISEFSRIISLSFRLFGNIFGGEVLVTVMYALLGGIWIGFATFIFLGVELLFGLIQALIFSILTLVFISTAVAGHAANDQGAHDAEHGAVQAKGQQVGRVLSGQESSQSLLGKDKDKEKVPAAEPKSGTEEHTGG